MDRGKRSKYKPQLIALAEGFVKLGIKFAANIDYYRLSTTGSGHLFRRQPFDVSKVRCFILGLECLMPSASRDTLEKLRQCRAHRVPVVVFDWIANWLWRLTPQQLKTQVLQYVDHYMYYSCSSTVTTMLLQSGAATMQCAAWPIGMTQRVIDVSAAAAKPFHTRRRAVLWSHRLLHALRKEVWHRFYEHAAFPVIKFHDQFALPRKRAATEGAEGAEGYDALMYHQTGRRHNPRYYEALGNTQLVDCCGGFWRSDGSNRRHITQWDSYKLWEAFAAGCCVITFDLKHYGLLTGADEEPMPGVHYIGLRLDEDGTCSTTSQLHRIIETADLALIASRGREWALRNFSPVERARRFVNTI